MVMKLEGLCREVATAAVRGYAKKLGLPAPSDATLTELMEGDAEEVWQAWCQEQSRLDRERLAAMNEAAERSWQELRERLKEDPDGVPF
jgi:hypothetical protein